MIEAVGSDVTYVRPGDHVITCVSMSCGNCRNCYRGRPHLCAHEGLVRDPAAVVLGAVPPVQKATRALEDGEPASAAIAALMPDDSPAPGSALEWAHLYEYGGGPGRRSTLDTLAHAEQALDRDAAWLRDVLARWSAADALRRRSVDALLGSG